MSDTVSMAPTASEKVYTPIELLWITLALGLGTFIQVLDGSIANVALPTIAGDLGVNPDMSTWVITSFSASNAVVLPLTGWLALRIGCVRLFAGSTLLFSLASLFCGLSFDLGMLVFFRILQGAVAGSLIPLSQSLLLTCYPKDKAGMALAFWSMIVVIAPILGPIVGGWICDNCGWEWIFYINIPIGILSAFMSWHFLKDRETPIKKNPVDLLGFFLLAMSVCSLQILLDKGAQLDWLASNWICLLIATSTLGFLSFIAWELRCPYPVVDLSIFKNRNFSLGLTITTLGFMMFFGSMVLLPLWLQNYEGYTAYWAGVAIAPVGLASILLSPLVGKVLFKCDIRLFPALSFLVYSFTFFWFSHLNCDISIWQIALPRLVQGIGVAGFMIPLVTLSLSAVPSHLLPSASGVFNFIRILFGAGIGTSCFITVFNNRIYHHESYLTESIQNFNPNLSSYTSNSIESSPEILYSFMRLFIDRESAVLALNDIFWACGWMFIVLACLLIYCKPLASKKPLAPPATH